MLGGKLDLIVGTPGRLTDMMRDQTIRTQNVSFTP
jgi:superfamily II DNA/RNA helicase